MKLIVTGGAGFIGSDFIRHTLEVRPDYRITNFDALTYAGNLQNLSSVESHPGYRFVRGDVTNREQVRRVISEGADAIVHFAAESHVDRSILDASQFILTNVVGTQNLLDALREQKGGRFLLISTDEVYGSLGPTGAFREDDPLRPNSPYAASKASADLLARAYVQTYSMDIVVTRCYNNYGPCQFPEKLIPLMTLNALAGKSLPVYGDGLYVRDWIHVADHSNAILTVLEQGAGGSIYNIGGDYQITNLDLVRRILEILGKPESLIERVRDRPGHDRRYAIDATKLKQQLSWKPSITFEDGLKATIEWYEKNLDWVTQVKTGEYREYYERMYSRRDETLNTL